MTLLETEYSLLVRQKGMALLDDWWSSLTKKEKREARTEAEGYDN